MDAVVPQDGRGPINGDGSRRYYLHNDEGQDDMPAHIRTALTSQTMSLSIDNNRLLLGLWQGVYLWEHRTMPHARQLACHMVGDVGTALHSDESSNRNQATLLQRRNGSRLNEIVQSRHNPEAWATDEGAETDIDLLVDRLHDIAEDPQ